MAHIVRSLHTNSKTFDIILLIEREMALFKLAVHTCR